LGWTSNCSASCASVRSPLIAASATFAVKAGVWFRRGRLFMVSPDSQAIACPLSGRNSTYRPVQISGAGSVVAAAASAGLISAPTLAADPVPQNDLLNAELWMQTAIEYRANCLTVYALAKVRLDEAVADTNWTAYDQTGSYQNLPPAVIIDLDETAIDNSAYEAGLVVNNTRFNPKT